jgi:type I restriction enzyme S subunit
MSKEKNLIPELRFPEFVNEGEWGETTLDNVVSDFIVPMRDKPKKLDGEIPWCRIEDFNGMYLSCSKSNQGVSLETVKEMNLKVYPVNTLLVSCSADLGRCAITQKPLITNQTFIGLVPNIKKVNTIYLYYVMTNARNELNARSSGTTISYLSRQQFEKFEIQLPKPDEQQKIASCLSSLDDVIAAHSQKLDLLKDHKKGLMQNLFPQEGEKVPKYRFKEFVNDGKWEQKPLDDICKFVRGPFGGALKKEIFVKDGYAVYEQAHAIYGDFSSFRYYIDNEKFSELKRFSVKYGDLIMSCSGTMGKFSIIPQDYKVGVINQALLKLTVKKGFDSIFVKMTLEAENNQNKLLSQSAGGAIKNVVSVSQIKELGLFMPSYKEQQRIADCLSSLDALIIAQAEKIEQLKLHKKGLMQGLFPKLTNRT